MARRAITIDEKIEKAEAAVAAAKAKYDAALDDWNGWSQSERKWTIRKCWKLITPEVRRLMKS